MKHVLTFIFLFFGFVLIAQDSLIISSHRFLYKELIACGHSKNQLLFLDSLILRTQHERPPSKGSGQRFFKIQNEKLVILHIDAGWLCRLRCDFKLAHEYLDKGKGYLDSLKKYGLYDDELKNTMDAYNYMQKEICYQTYRKDTTLFFAWDCATFFPELNEYPVITSDTLSSDSTNRINDHQKEDFGTFYLNDSLRIKKQFTSDSAGVAYFNSIRFNLLNELRHSTIPELLLEMMVNQPFRQDTLILKLSLECYSDKILKESSLAFSTVQPAISRYYLTFFSNIKYHNVPEKVSFFIPIILRPESPNNYNEMHRVVMDDGYFLIEYKRPNPIETH